MARVGLQRHKKKKIRIRRKVVVEYFKVLSGQARAESKINDENIRSVR